MALLLKQEGDGVILILHAGTKEITCEFPKHILWPTFCYNEYSFDLLAIR